MKRRRIFRLPLLLVLASLFVWASASARAEDWKPVDPSHLVAKSPSVEKDADAEAIFWEVSVSDQFQGGDAQTVVRNYLRIKIFTPRGVESEGNVTIPFTNRSRIGDIAARTIKPDGAIVELKKEAIFERDIIKFGKFKYKSKSFAMPAVEPGVIIEYRWNEYRDTTRYVHLDVQREIPVQLVKVAVKPLTDTYFREGMRVQMFNGSMSPFQKVGSGMYGTELRNVPAFREESRMPPEDNVKRWMLIYYTEDKKLDPEKFWKEFGKERYADVKDGVKVDDSVRDLATKLTAGASDPERKLEVLYEHCRTQVKNVGFRYAFNLQPEEIEKFKVNKSPSETLKRGVGSPRNINHLFIALATAAGFQARVALVADRSQMFFDPNFVDGYFLNNGESVAVQVGDTWRFFDPGSAYVPFGSLRWQEEGQQALILDAKSPQFVTTPITPSEKTKEKRVAKLSISETGTLEGDVRIEYTGQLAIEKKIDWDDDSAEAREKSVMDEVKSRLPGAEVSNVKVENAADLVNPVKISYHVKMPGYAQRTGKRLFFQPAFFCYGERPTFSTSQRIHDIYFSYPAMEEDEVLVTLPEGYDLDHAESPASFPISDVGKYGVRIFINKAQRLLTYKRTFAFGNPSVLTRFEKAVYPQLKAVFDEIRKQDEHSLTLKQTAAVTQPDEKE
jgi:transglutaminase-like putative cysteine protease